MSELMKPLSLAVIRDGERLELEADETVRAAIAERLGLVELERMKAHVILAKDGQQIDAEGRLQASLTQSCVATGEPVRAMIDEPFALAFRPEPSGTGPDDEVELDADEMDTIFHDGREIDLGKALEDTLSLALDPYPRSAGADAALKDAGVLSEEEAGPFSALAALKEKMEKR